MLKIKEEYKEWSIGLKHFKKVKLSNLDPHFYEEAYKIYPDFFINEGEKKVVKPIEEKINNLDDTNK